jgi:hypothetical protein
MSIYASGKYAKGLCDRCGLTYKLLELKPLVVARKQTGWLVCPSCWEPDNPRWFSPAISGDAMTLRTPRPDNKNAPGLVAITWGWNPVWSIEAKAQVGTVTVVIQ